MKVNNWNKFLEELNTFEFDTNKFSILVNHNTLGLKITITNKQTNKSKSVFAEAYHTDDDNIDIRQLLNKKIESLQ